MVAMKSSTMNYLQSWIEELNPLASLPLIAPFSDRDYRRLVRGQPNPVVSTMTTAPPSFRKTC
jgi:hypothetical protein